MARTVKVDLPPFTLIGADDAAGTALAAAPRPLRHHAAPRLLRRRGSVPDHRPLGRHPLDRDHAGGLARDRLARAGHAAHRESAAAPAARLRRGRREEHDRPRDRARGAVPSRGRRARLRRARPADSLDDHREVRRRARRRRRDRGVARRGPRHARGPLRALPAPGRLPAAHAPRPHRLGRGVPASGNHVAPPGRGAVLAVSVELAQLRVTPQSKLTADSERSTLPPMKRGLLIYNPIAGQRDRRAGG